LKKATKAILGILTGLLIIAVFFYIMDIQYYKGIEKHYKGESIITQEQGAYLASELSIYRNGDVTKYEILEDGTISIEYDFYSELGLDYLNSNNYSIFDSPTFDWLFSLTVILTVSGMLLLIAFFVVDTSGIFRIEDIGWYIIHPHFLYHIKRARGIYKPNIVNSINIKDKENGIICVRSWKYRRGDGHLYSAGVGQLRWTNSIQYANKLPTIDNDNGMYSFRIGLVRELSFEYPKDILGIVQLSGTWLEHADGVMRAERCKILQLVISERLKSAAENLSSLYGIPVMITSDTVGEYEKWLYGEQGVKLLANNNKLLSKGEICQQEKESLKKGAYPIKEKLTSRS
jgi:hypothetical protein